MKTCAIHQPNYFPWIGYWIKLASADTFILYDSCPLNENGYSRRVKIQPNRGQEFWSSLELLPHKHGTAINNVEINLAQRNKRILLSQLKSAYNSLPYYISIRDIVEEELNKYSTSAKLANFNMSIIRRLSSALSLQSTILNASSLTPYTPGIPMLLNLCLTVEATHYMSGTGALKYLKPKIFEKSNLLLNVIDFKEISKKVFPDDTLDQSILGLLAKYGEENLKERLLQAKSHVLKLNETLL